MELRDQERTACEVYTRVMGYHRPLENWNKGKQAEYAERTYFDEKITVATSDKLPTVENNLEL